MKVRVVNNEIVEFGLPSKAKLDDRWVSNYHRLPNEILMSAGWKDVVDPGSPIFDLETQMVESNIELLDGIPTIVYQVLPLPKTYKEADDIIDRLQDLSINIGPYERAWLQSKVELLINSEIDEEEQSRLHARYVEVI